VTHYNREEVDRRMARLWGAYDSTVEEESVELEPEAFDEFAEHAAEGYIGGGYAWVVREEPPPLSDSMPAVEEAYPRVLLVLGRDDGGWGPPGGGREGDEEYEEATVREVREETGVECTLLDCRRIRRTTFERADTGEEAAETAHTLSVFFVARATGGSIDVQESELNGAAWFRDLPADLHWSVESNPWSWEEWQSRG
jgi:ADP-ribose pyrophosphatase YjhB (NUDIX family)